MGTPTNNIAAEAEHLNSNSPEENTATDAPILNSDDRRGLRWYYLRVAAVAAIGSIVLGSLILVSALELFFDGDFSLSEFLTLWLIYAIYSGAVVLPIAIFLAFPLMVFLRRQSDSVWIICSTVAGIGLGSAALFAVSHNVSWPVFLLFATYAAIFGILAALLRPSPYKY